MTTDKIQWALNTLFPKGEENGGPAYLILDKYQPAITSLRKKDPALARRVERTLKLIFPEYFPRRKYIKWDDTYRATKARINLLPHNPYLRKDISDIRNALGLPDEQIKIPFEQKIYSDKLQLLMKPRKNQEKVSQEEAQRIIGVEVLLEWLKVFHEVETKHQIADSDLPLDIRKMAIKSAEKTFNTTNFPVWLQEHLTSTVNDETSFIDKVIDLLIKRHRLPFDLYWKYAIQQLKYYLLTNNPEWVTNLGYKNIIISPTFYKGSYVTHFNATITNIDETFTFEDWTKLWNKYIKPENNALLEASGSIPQGRLPVGVDFNKLEKRIKFFEPMINNNLSPQEIANDCPKYLDLNDDEQNLEQESIVDSMKKLKTLLEPND
ncbi:hypothetical protein ASJ33_07670 [Dehalococcoides mccartyi]|jgi:hypothetical protein|uniref:hypothetical protein n=1 Tax=Dehalococcoides TaxID=61434 RepID=UPI0005B5754B|nr:MULTISPECIES: hypothetical protein [Dehalococcoides]APH13041.1 hypothetical protein ASJ33_07670 [Dehalococcoides mccartyi]QYY57567.1 hypothetical protein CWV2_000783 [Dehalococcoides mccartyi]BAQ35261.1 hypothetical protein UCH007_13030 [Dehalococcoides sp. UCH007]